jgi:tetratricopeptide (TPR) repeat protein
MKRIRHWGFRAVLVLAVFLCGLAPRVAAQSSSGIHGRILDREGKPWADLVIQAVTEQGQKRETKTDKHGEYSFHALMNGKYELNVMIANQAQPYEVGVYVATNEDKAVDLDFKEIAAKLLGANAEAAKKLDEEKQKFTNMKKSFDSGVVQLDLAHSLRDSLAKTPAADRDKVKQQLSDASKEAVADFEGARKAAPEKDPNLSTILARLAEAYDISGRTDDAILAYQEATKIKEVGAYYINLGNLQARAGKVEDARTAYMKSIDLDPASAAQAWRNFGFALYNANRLSDAVEPLQKAVALDAKNPQAWYCLGASLLNSMKTKMVGDTMQVELAPGTVEAYQKAVELDPNGPFGQLAKQGLEAIEQMAPGIQTKYGKTPPKKKP